MRVRLFERRDVLGGTTALSVGSFCAAGTRMQRRLGIVDSPDAYLEDMAAFIPDLAPREPPGPRAMLVVEAAPTLHWLERLGVSFAGPYLEPPHRVARLHM